MADADAPTPRRVRETAAGKGLRLTALIATGRPTVVRGAARDWPLVRAGLDGPEALAVTLRAADAGRPVTAYVGAPAGRFHYREGEPAMNFTAERGPLGGFLDRLLAGLDEAAAPALYLGSTDLDAHLPGIGAANPLPVADDTFARYPPLASIWIGNRTVAPTHWDQSNNVAVCVAGRRRFTLFPPGEVANLYPGPIEPTPAGQVVSMVDPARPDLARYPRFAAALAAAEVAELEPGDALVYPALWWHNVEALAPFNVLVNYWWNEAPAHADTPMTTLLHALLSLRDRPAAEKEAWRAMFNWYVFGDAAQAAAHLPAPMQGPLGPLDAQGARRLRALVANRLAR